ncbi:hypothetical protein Y032_0227g2825 [Ancylostoma ceylanicum]|uniref:Uncharacterized protein n=1 Tax=Ancylostoma ceylanicum TaxID=53326 RepID=A0A016SGV1_9BILA|nr:hypothetical protein Y032_0227g2825 [Ancylostoma ceylanicum]
MVCRLAEVLSKKKNYFHTNETSRFFFSFQKNETFHYLLSAFAKSRRERALQFRNYELEFRNLISKIYAVFDSLIIW